MITPAQCRAARGLIDWSQKQLADAARVGVVTIRQLENAAAQPRRATADVIRQALETAGVIFVEENGEGPGVRLRKAKPAISGEVAVIEAPKDVAKDYMVRQREGGGAVARSMKAEPRPIAAGDLNASYNGGLPEYFVWSTPALVRVIDAPDAQTAAEIFLGHVVSPVPVLGQLPVCFVQATLGLQTPNADGDTVEYWFG
jgi:transcriptional regulator with XRE-family HTH domain